MANPDQYIFSTFAQPVACVELDKLIIFSVVLSTEDRGTKTTKNQKQNKQQKERGLYHRE